MTHATHEIGDAIANVMAFVIVLVLLWPLLMSPIVGMALLGHFFR